MMKLSLLMAIELANDIKKEIKENNTNSETIKIVKDIKPKELNIDKTWKRIDKELTKLLKVDDEDKDIEKYLQIIKEREEIELSTNRLTLDMEPKTLEQSYI